MKVILEQCISALQLLHERLIGEADGTSIKTNHLARTWKVGIKKRDRIKGRRGEKEKGTIHSGVKLVTRLEKYI